MFIRGLNVLLNPFLKGSWSYRKTSFFIDLTWAIYGDFAGVGRTGGGYAIGKIYDTSTPIGFWDTFFGVVSKTIRF